MFYLDLRLFYFKNVFYGGSSIKLYYVFLEFFFFFDIFIGNDKRYFYFLECNFFMFFFNVIVIGCYYDNCIIIYFGFFNGSNDMFYIIV